MRRIIPMLMIAGAGVVLTVPATAEKSTGDVLCEWKELDLFEDDHAHSTNCETMPPQAGNDWQVVSSGQYPNQHSFWVYSTIAGEAGNPHGSP